MSSEIAVSLKRSASPPSQPDGAEGSEQQGRQRARAACAPCRQRKRKCDGQLPCSTCTRYEYQCVYTSSKRSSTAPANDAAQESSQTASTGHTRPHRIQQQPHPLTAPGARFHHRGIMDPIKTRFVRANSAIAFPRILGMDLESETIPRLHSFAWHLGVRAEPTEPTVEVTSLLTWSEMQDLSTTYFATVRSEIGHLEESDFLESAAVRFAHPQGETDIDAVILGVAALGSFFSSTPNHKESEFVFHADKLLAQLSLKRSPTPNNVAGWILRTIYLRLTGRPHAAWMASCITLHQGEASGLHKEMQTIAVVYPALPAGDHKLAKTRRKLFWIARALNIIFSFEYGRSRVGFEIVTTKKFAAESGTHAHQFVELADVLPNDYVDIGRDPDPPGELTVALTKIEAMQSESSFIQLLKADLAFAIYRRLWLMSLTDAKDRVETVLAIGKDALEASSKLLETRTSWWNVVGAPFQFLCVALAIGTPRSLAIVPDIMKQLQRVAEIYDTHMVREAYNQALALVNMAKKRKEKELDSLNPVAELTPYEDPPTAASSSYDTSMIDWASMELPFEWDMFLNPDLVMSSQQDMSAMYGAGGSQFS